MLAKMNPQRSKQHNLWIVALTAVIAAAVFPIAARFSTPAAPVLGPAKVDFGKLPLSIEPNEGQTDESVRFLTHASGGTLYFTPGEVVLSLRSGTKSEGTQASAVGNLTQDAAVHASQVSQTSQASVVRVRFMDANPSTTIQSGDLLLGRVNYFISNDPSKWHSDLPTYGNITYKGLYSGIDLTYSGTDGQLKGTYTVAAGSDPSQIRWRYSGAEKVTVDKIGNLQITVADTNKDAQAVTVTEQVPVAWQEIAGTRNPVSARYLIAADQSISFVLGSYDHNHPLIIDPTLIYSTYLGGSGSDEGRSIAVDASGNAYVTGYTNSTNFPLQNPFQPTHRGDYDVFVTKFNATGSTLLYSTYLGGSSYDFGYGIAVDASGNAYVTGRTASTNFPLQNSFQPTYAGGNSDAFVTKFSATGSTLLYSTYLGGSDRDDGYGIGVDASGNAYVTGNTVSTNFPLQNPFQPIHGGGTYDVFVTKFSSTGSTLLYSTYLGGSSNDGGNNNDIAVDTLGNAYVTGFTNSTNFPLQNPFQPTYGGFTYDAFVTKFSATGSTLVYSTYLGGSRGDEGRSIAVDASGNAYVTGYTTSTDFPLQNPFQPTHAGDYDVFVTKFSATGSTLIYSTYLGGTQLDFGWGVAVDASGNAYVTGYTTSTDFPLQNPFQSTYGGGTYDAFVAKFSATGSILIYSTYLGGNDNDIIWGVAVDSSGNAYVTGRTASTNFPLASTPFQSTNAGGNDAFVAKINDQSVSTPTATFVPPTTTPTNIPTGTPRPTNSPVPVETNTPVPVATNTPVPVETNTPVPVPSGSPTSTSVPQATNTSVPVPTNTSVPVATNTSVPLPTACHIQFLDVPSTNAFYANIRCLACRSTISGYSDGTFRPNNEVTRGQLAKIVSNAAGFTESPDPQVFEDVSSANTFYQWINRLARRGHMSGYACGGVGEPCTSGMPYFRPSANATRGQTSKIVSNAASYSEIPTDQTFEDVPPTHTFYMEIQRLASRNIMQGYSCGGVGEPCLSGKPYFRPANNVTRGQSAKIVANAFYPDCETP